MSLMTLMTSALVLTGVSAIEAEAQERRGRPPEVRSPEVSVERKITFRIHAPNAKGVKLTSSDLPGVMQGTEMKGGENGVWETTTDIVAAGAYRYCFQIDGVSVLDPHHTSTSEANSNAFSLVQVPGSETFDTKDVPHGAVAQVTYHSKSLATIRRMHVYTPPGYERGEGSFPVLYLLHGATDSDNSWSTVGRAGIILDNLIATGKARPMVVVMPNGHTGPFSFGGPNNFDRQMDEFFKDFTQDIRPHVEKNYRLKPGRANRAITGLSMGGAQSLNIGFDRLEDFGSIGVFSSGIFGIVGGFGGTPPSTKWEDAHKATLDNADLKRDLKLVWVGCGKEDFLRTTSDATVAMLKKHGFHITYRETDGGHTWIVWRDYLSEFVPLLFAE